MIKENQAHAMYYNSLKSARKRAGGNLQTAVPMLSKSQVSNAQRSILLRQAQSNKVLSRLRYFTHSQTDIKTEAGCRREWCHWDFHFSFQLFNDSTKELDSYWFFRWWRGKREKYLPSHMPDRSKDRQRKGEKRSSLFYDMRSLCSTQDVLKMLLAGSR